MDSLEQTIFWPRGGSGHSLYHPRPHPRSQPAPCKRVWAIPGTPTKWCRRRSGTSSLS